CPFAALSTGPPPPLLPSALDGQTVRAAVGPGDDRARRQEAPSRARRTAGLLARRERRARSRPQPQDAPPARADLPARRLRWLSRPRRWRAQRDDLPRSLPRGRAHRGAERPRLAQGGPIARDRLVLPAGDGPPPSARGRARALAAHAEHRAARGGARDVAGKG